jgi:hypothetical protein
VIWRIIKDNNVKVFMTADYKEFDNITDATLYAKTHKDSLLLIKDEFELFLLRRKKIDKINNRLNI